MHTRKKSLVILICLFLISFKVAAGSVFIDAAIERVQMHKASCSCFVIDSDSVNKTNGDGKQQAHILFLMSHVTANMGEIAITIFPQPMFSGKFFVANKVLYTQNFPESVFKPPKVIA